VEDQLFGHRPCQHGLSLLPLTFEENLKLLVGSGGLKLVERADLDFDSTRIQVDALGHTPTPP